MKKPLIKEANEKIEVLKTDIAKYLSEYKEFSDLMAQILAAKELLNFARNRLNKFYRPKLYKPTPKRKSYY